MLWGSREPVYCDSTLQRDRNAYCIRWEIVLYSEHASVTGCGPVSGKRVAFKMRLQCVVCVSRAALEWNYDRNKVDDEIGSECGGFDVFEVIEAIPDSQRIPSLPPTPLLA